MKSARTDPPGGDAVLINVIKADPPGEDAVLINVIKADPPGGASSPGDAVDLDLFELSRRLQQAGWDAFASELTGEVAARQDQRPDRAVWAMVIDRSGRWRCTITRPLRVATARKLPAGGQIVHLLDETRQITTITGTLRQASDLPELLAGLEETA